MPRQQAVTGAGPAGAGLLYDARCGVHYARPVLRDWLRLLCFCAPLAQADSSPPRNGSTARDATDRWLRAVPSWRA
jgi:hypothetical protein